MNKMVHFILLSIALSAGFFSAVKSFWVSDDAFISFRYALNFVNGHGLVFNYGERVEGFTNFLWTVILIPFIKVGLDPIIYSNAISLFLFVLLLVIVALWGHSVTRTKDWQAYWTSVPLSICGLALHKHTQIFATSGLETMLFTFLCTYGILLISTDYENFFSEKSKTEIRKIRGLPGLTLLVLSAMTRPDGLLIYGISALSVLFLEYNIAITDQSKSKFYLKIFEVAKRVFIANFFFAFVFIPYWMARWSYYGKFFPNTFYAKSGNLSYWSQGAFYLYTYFVSYWVFLILPILMLYVFIGKKYRNTGKDVGSTIALITVFSWSFYLFKLGGDFMFARFIIPITPLLFLLTEKYLLCILFNSKNEIIARFLKMTYAPTFISLFFIVTVLLRYDFYKGEKYPNIRGISEEYKVYPIEFVHNMQKKAAQHKTALVESKAKIAILGAEALLAYYWNPVETIEAVSGLTDSFIASQEVKERGMPGHEKEAPIEYLRDRRVNLRLAKPPSDRDHGFNQISMDGMIGYGEIVAYVPSVMLSLKKHPGIQFKDFNEFLKEYISRHPSKETVTKDLPVFKEYYFRYAPEDKRLSLLEKIAQGAK